MSQADLAEVWARSLEELSDLQIEPHQRAWLRLTRPLGLVENTALIATPNEFVKEQLETRLRGLITHALSREFGRNIQLAVTVDPATAAGGMPGPRDAASPHPAGPGIPDHGTGGHTGGGHDGQARHGSGQSEMTGPLGTGGVHRAGPGDLPADNGVGAYPHPFGYPSPGYPPQPGHGSSPGHSSHPRQERDAADGLIAPGHLNVPPMTGGPAITGRDTRDQGAPPLGGLPLSEGTRHGAEPPHRQSSFPGLPAPGLPRPAQARLNPKYTFETFVIGSSNRF